MANRSMEHKVFTTCAAQKLGYSRVSIDEAFRRIGDKNTIVVFSGNPRSGYAWVQTLDDTDGDVAIRDIDGNLWHPCFDDKKGEKENWEAGQLEAELDNFPQERNPKL